MGTYEIKTWRRDVNKKPVFGQDIPSYPTTRFFDNMAFVGDSSTACFLVETTEGLLLIDCLEPRQRSLDLIYQGIKDIGYELSDLKAVLITHGHGDHYGLCGQIRKDTGAKLYMSKGDYELARTKKIPLFPLLDTEMDGFLEDGQVFTLGNVGVKCVLTPGHTPNCMSFIIPVTDCGKPHNLALWGGTLLLPGSNVDDYLNSVEKFDGVCDEYNVDAEISNHPGIDNGIERLNVVRSITSGVPNPFVIGRDNYKIYEDKFRQFGLEAKKNGLMSL